MKLSFSELRASNVARMHRWHGEADDWSLADWSNAMCGEAGEAANIVKKIRRHETGTGMGYNTPEVEALLPALAKELADLVIYADLVAHKAGIDLDLAVVEKFNLVSEAQGFPERLGDVAGGRCRALVPVPEHPGTYQQCDAVGLCPEHPWPESEAA